MTERPRRLMHDKSTKEISFAELRFHEACRTSALSEGTAER